MTYCYMNSQFCKPFWKVSSFSLVFIQTQSFSSMKGLIGASHLSIEQNTQLLIYYGFVLLLFPSHPAVKVTVRLGSHSSVSSSVFHDMAAVSAQLRQYRECGYCLKKKKRFQQCSYISKRILLVLVFAVSIIYNDTAVSVSYNEAAPVLTKTLLNTICFPKPLNITWDLTVTHTKGTVM